LKLNGLHQFLDYADDVYISGARERACVRACARVCVCVCVCVL